MNYAIIAAGEGSRLVEEGVKYPKPLVPINGVPLIRRLINIFLENNAITINVIVNEEMTEVQEYLNNLELPVLLRVLVKSTPSSLHSLYELSKIIKGTHICLTTVDTVFKREEFSKYIRMVQRERVWDGVMAVSRFVDDEKPLYVETDSNLLITNFMDKENDWCRYVSGGIYYLRQQAIQVLEEAVNGGMSRMRNYQRLLVEKELKLKAYPFGKIIDVDHAGDILKAEMFLNYE